MKLTDTRNRSRSISRLAPHCASRVASGVALFAAVAVLAACGSPDPKLVDYKSATKSAPPPSLAVPPDMTNEVADQRSLPPQGGETSFTRLQQIQQQPNSIKKDDVAPAVSGMHIQRDGTQRWLVIDAQSPGQVWPQARRFWQEQGYVLNIEAPDRDIMETDWNETHPAISDGLIRNTLSKALSSSYSTGLRDKYRTRLEAAPNGGTYVFISQRGLREALSGPNNESSNWVDRPNDPALEAEYLKRLMAALALNQQRGPGAQQVDVVEADTAAASAAAADQAKPHVRHWHGGDASATSKAAGPTEINLTDSYDNAWLRVGRALDRDNFTVDDRDRVHGLYFVRYVDPTDLRSQQQGFWSQMFKGKIEKVAKQYRVNVRALTPTQTRVAVLTENDQIDDSKPARQIMSLLADQLH
jgi:outer membrane protein assembly factor BamC